MGVGIMDFIARTAKNNRALIGTKKSLKTIYQENNLLYVKRRVAEKTKHYDENQKRIFLERFYAKRKKARQKRTVFLLVFIVIFSALVIWIFQTPGVL